MGRPGQARGYLYRVVLGYAQRPDVFRSRRVGFSIATAWRCTSIETQLAEDAGWVALRRVELDYQQAPGNDVSLLTGVRVLGLGGDEPPSFPPLALDYTSFAPTARRLVEVTGASAPPFSLAQPDVELLDIDGSSCRNRADQRDRARVAQPRQRRARPADRAGDHQRRRAANRACSWPMRRRPAGSDAQR